VTNVDDRPEDGLLPAGGFTPFPVETDSVTIEFAQAGLSTGHRRRVVRDKIDWLDSQIKALLIQTCLDPVSSLLLDLQRFRIPTDSEWQQIETRLGIRYYAYLESDQWKQRRLFMIRRAGYRCQICNGRRKLQVHHRTYERVGEERIDDLTVLCAECHKLFHRHRRIDR
jgi:hypothetical protein